jgi:NAD(P)-dependent dehydrogenase (short-subunit alcohol dehydrogenase family)
MQLQGQVAAVTGAGRGIGRATALALAEQGAAVAVLARSKDEIAETAATIRDRHGLAVAVRLDVTDAEAVQQAFAQVVGEFGEIDLLVNNAGKNTVFGPAGEVDPRRWWDDVTTNLLGPMLCTAAVLPGMLRRGRGRVVNVVSAVAGRSNPNNTSYGCAKTALVSFTDSVAAETAGTGVAVFAFAPGPIRTRLMADISDDPSGARYLGGVLSKITYLPPEIPAQAIVELATGRADVLSGRYLDSLDDLVSLTDRAGEILDQDLCKLRIRKPAPAAT